MEIYPEFAEAWQVLGEVRLEVQARAAGRAASERALAAAAEMSQQALEINPRLVRAHYFGALADSSLGNPKEAEAAARWVQSSSEADMYPVTYYILGWIQAKREGLELAAAEYRQFMEIQPTAPVGRGRLEQFDQWESLGLIDTPKSPVSEEGLFLSGACSEYGECRG